MQIHVGGKILLLDRFLLKKIGAQVLLVIVGENRNHDRLGPQFILNFQGAKKVRSR